MRFKLILLLFFCSFLKNVAFAQIPQDVTIDSVTVLDDATARIVWPSNTDPTVDSFRIYRLYSIVPGNPTQTFNLVATVGATITSYHFNQPLASPDIPGKKSLRFFVGAFDATTNQLSPLDSIGVKPHQTIFIRAAEDLCTKTASLSWNQYSNGSNGWASGVSNYELYESIDGNPFALIAKGPNLLGYNTKLIGGLNFRYKIVARGTGVSSTSNIISLTPQFANPPTVTYVTNATVSLSNKRATVAWYSGATVPTNYVILMSTDSVNYTQVKRLVQPSALQTEIDNLVCDRFSYYFKVATESFQPGCPPVLDTSLNYGKTILLTATFVSNTTNTLEWSDYEDWSSGVAKYEVYRVVNNADELIATYPGTTTFHTDVITDASILNEVISYYILAYESVDPIDQYNPNPLPARSNYAYIYKELKILVPNIFTPNGRNPVFLPKILATQIGSFNMQIFNRWGKLVYETNNEFEGWDGRDKNTSHTCQPGSYVYIVEVKDSTGKTYKTVGNVAVLD